MGTISLGSVVNVGGKTVLQGSQTGLDTEGIINDLVSIKEAEKTGIEDSISLQAEKIAAYQTLQQRVEDFLSTLDILRSPPGINNDAQDVFKYRTTSTVSNDSNNPDNFITVSASPGAAVGSYNLEVNTVAQETVQTIGGIAVADANTSVVGGGGALNAGTLELRSGDSIEVYDGDTLLDIANRINNISDSTNISATVIQTGAGVYALQFRGTITGTDNDFDIDVASNTDPGGVLETATITTNQTADNASFDINGTTVTSQSNTVTDAIDGITFTVKQQTGIGQVVTSTISADTDLINSSVNNFVNAFNDLKLFISEQTERKANGQFKDTAVLGGEPALNTIKSVLETGINNLVNGLEDGEPRSLFSLTNTGSVSVFEYFDFAGNDEYPATDNLLSIDAAELNNLLVSDLDAVANVFAFDSQSSNADLYVTGRPANVDSLFEFGEGDPEITINIDTTAGTAVATYVDADEVVQEVNLSYKAFAGGANISVATASVVQKTSVISVVDEDTSVVDGGGPFNSGTLELKDGITVTIDPGFSLNDIADAINATTSTSGVRATILNPSEGSYRLQLESPVTNTDDKLNINVSDNTDPGGVLENFTIATTEEANDDTRLKGFSFVYASAVSDAAATINLSQGFADALYLALDSLADPNTGIIANAIDSLNDQTADLEEDLADLEVEIEDFRVDLLNRYAVLESAISSANSTLLLLEALFFTEQS